MARASYYATPLLRSLVHRPQGVILVIYLSIRGCYRDDDFYLKTLQCNDRNIPALHFQFQINLLSKHYRVEFSSVQGGPAGTDLVFGQLGVVLQHAHYLHVLARAAHENPVLVDALKLQGWQRSKSDQPRSSRSQMSVKLPTKQEPSE